MKRSMLALAALIALAIAGGNDARADEPLQVVATTSMIADAARVIGGEEVDVRALMGPGVDPHSYRQTRSDIAAAARADLVLRHGLYLEAQMEAFFEGLTRRVPVTAVAETLPRDVLFGHNEYQDKFDPHVWMDPGLWADVVVAVRDALIEVAPDHAADFTARADAYLDEIAALDAYAAETIVTIPDSQRVLVTAHDAFAYFGHAYGVSVLGIQGISTESEAGLQRISALVDEIVEREVQAVFVETSVSDRNVRALAEGAGAKGHTLSIGGELYSDAMGVPGTYEGTYLGMIDHNVTTITNALGGEAPPAGRIGRLGVGG